MTGDRDEEWLDELRDLVPADPPEPWADAAPVEGLTDEQQAFLDALADTPRAPRLDDLGVFGDTHPEPDAANGDDDPG